MSISNQKTRLFYVVVPKVACTSIKTMFWELETGRDSTARSPLTRIRAKLTGKSSAFPIHHIDGYITRKFTRVGEVPDGYAKICVVRDPIARLRSAWTNKVGARIFAQRGETEDIVNSDLELEPSFGFYVENLERYRLVSRASRVHTENYPWHIGPELGWYDHVFRLEDLPIFEAFVSERAGRKVKVPSRNESGTTNRPIDFERRHVDALRRALRPDFDLLGAHYDFDESLARFAAREGLTL